MAKVTEVKAGDLVYVIDAFDYLQWKRFTPDPGVFLNASEAQQFCEDNSKRGVVMAWQKVAIGRMRKGKK